MNRLQATLVTTLIIGLCFLTGMTMASDAKTTPEQQKISLQAEFKELSAQYQIQQLTKENAELRMERIAKRASEIQQALKTLEPQEEAKTGPKKP